MPWRASCAWLLVVVLTAAGAASAQPDVTSPPSGTDPTPIPPETDATPPPPPPAGFRGSFLPEQWQRTVPPSPVLAVPSVITRDGEVQRVTLKEAIAIALENNPGIAARRLEPTKQEEGIYKAQGKFDPNFASELGYDRSDLPNSNLLAGGNSTTNAQRYANFHLMKLLRTGTQFSVDFLNDRNSTTNAFSNLSPNYSPELGLSVVQPLLRNFGWDFSYLVVRVAEQTADAALHQYEAALADFVIEVIAAYWDVIRAREFVDVQQEFKTLADRTVEENEARVRVGLLAPVAVLEAQADAALREEQVISAENELTIARQRLAKLAYYSPRGTTIPRVLEPVGEAVPEEFPVDQEEALQLAIRERPEVQASANQVQARQLDEKIASNGVLPRVDAIGTLGYDGLAGGRRCGRTGTNPDGTCRFPSQFEGPPTDAYRNLTDFRSYSFGLELQVPIANATADSQYVQSKISRVQAELNHRDLLSQVALEVYQSASQVIAGRKRIETSEVAVRLAEENLRNQQKRQEVGMATTKDLLDFQTRLRNARATEVQARTDYAVAVSRWQRAQGALLRTYQIVVEAPGKRFAPWFAKF